MRAVRCLILAGFVCCLLVGSAEAQEADREKLRKELIEKLDKKLEEFRNDMVEEIDRVLGGKVTRKPPRVPQGPGKPFLGITVRALTEGERALLDVPDGVGIMVQEVRAGSGAHEAGIVRGDIILAVGNKRIDTPETLGACMRGRKVGDTLRVTLIHRMNKKEIDVTLGRRPETMGAATEPEVEKPDKADTSTPSRPKKDESLEDFLERVLKKKDAKKDDSGRGQNGPPKNPPMALPGDPEQLQEMLKKLLGGEGGDLQKSLEEMMKGLFPGGEGEDSDEMMKQAQEMLKKLFENQGQGGGDLEKMFKEFMPKGPDSKGGEEPERKEGMDRLNKLLDEVLEGSEEKKDASNRKAFLGLSLRPVSPAVRTQMNIDDGTGLLVAGVLEDSPAHSAGVARFDVLVAVDGKNVGSLSELAEVLGDSKAGDEITLTLVRKGGKIEKKVVLGAPR